MRRLTELPRAGSTVRVRFDTDILEGTVLYAHGTLVRVRLNIEGSDEPYDGLYELSELIAA